MDEARERAYAEVCRRMDELPERNPRDARFDWGIQFLHTQIELGGLTWDDLEPLWQRWQTEHGLAAPKPRGRGRQPGSRSQRGGVGCRQQLPDRDPDGAPG